MSEKDEKLKKVLEELKLEKYYAKFLEEETLFCDLKELNEDELEILIPKRIHRKRLINFLDSQKDKKAKGVKGEGKVEGVEGKKEDTRHVTMKVKFGNEVNDVVVPLGTNEELIGKLLQSFLECELKLSDKTVLRKEMMITLDNWLERTQRDPESEIRGVLSVKGNELFSGGGEAEEQLKIRVKELEKKLVSMRELIKKGDRKVRKAVVEKDARKVGKAVLEEKTKKKYLEEYSKKVRYYVDLARCANAPKRRGVRETLLEVDLDQRVYSFPFFLLWAGDRDGSFEYQVALEVYENVVQRKKQNKFDDLIKLKKVNVKPVSKKQMDEDRELYRKFITVTQYLYYGLQVLRREHHEIRTALNSFRMALAYDNNNKNEKISRRAELVMYAAATATQFFEQAMTMLRNGKSQCVAYFNCFFEFIDPLLHDQFIKYLKHEICEEFFGTLDEVSRRYSFNQYKCDKLNGVIDRFIYYSYSLPDIKPVLKKEKPSYVEKDVPHTIEPFTLDNKTLATNLKKTMEMVNFKLYHIIQKYKSVKVPMYRRISSIREHKNKFKVNVHV